MSAPEPLPLGAVLSTEMNRRMGAMDHHLRSDDPQIIQWLDQMPKVRAASPALEALCQANIYHMMGDTARFEEWIAVARRNDAPWDAVFETQVVGYANLSYATKGYEVFRRLVDIARLNVGRLIGLGVSLGAFQRIEELATQAANAKIDLSGIKLLPEWIRAAQILRDRSLSDEDCAKVVDVAGSLLREHQLFWTESSPRLLLSEAAGEVVLRFRVDLTPDEASVLTGVLVDRLVSEGLDVSPLLVNFVGTKH
ncbi:conserved hypothetical protein [Burkholderiales bacterium 8X]|nr:conserved hypothetical protein [Burkholderiales bacterium 8X]